jgi:capsular polysaccharide export protein
VNPKLGDPWSPAIESVPPDGLALGREARRHFLFVTAPFGPFSRSVGQALRAKGVRCTRVILNGGDLADWGPVNAAPYFGRPQGWERWLFNLARRECVTDVIVFGDGNPYARAATGVARTLNLRLHVLEEGYLRPGWVTLERDGVNGDSALPRDPLAYLADARAESVPVGPPAPSSGAAHTVLRVVAYHLWVLLGAWAFNGYRNPYFYSPARQALGHIVRILRQLMLIGSAGRRLRELLEAPGPTFLVLLQRPGDSQLLRHSPLRTNPAMIAKTIASFAAHAPADAKLIFKAHPLDHGLESLDLQVSREARAHELERRVAYVDSADLEVLLSKVAGVVTINSTGGLAALSAGVATIALGRAIYDLPGLTFQGELDQFWRGHAPPDARFFTAFRRLVASKTQVVGSFATRRGVRIATPKIVQRLLAT